MTTTTSQPLISVQNLQVAFRMSKDAHGPGRQAREF